MKNKTIKILFLLSALLIFSLIVILSVLEVNSYDLETLNNEQILDQEIETEENEEDNETEKLIKITETKETEIEEENKLVSLGTFKLTAYCPCTKCCGKDDGITASGTIATQGRTIACNSLPAGTEVVIKEQTYIVEDTGNLGDKTIDIFFDSHQEALIFGKQYEEVFIYDN